MARWKERLDRLTGKGAAEREAAFEAEMLAQAGTTPSPSAAPAAPDVVITVTVDGRTETYRDLASVPPVIRQRVTAVWQATPYRPAGEPPR